MKTYIHQIIFGNYFTVVYQIRYIFVKVFKNDLVWAGGAHSQCSNMKHEDTNSTCESPGLATTHRIKKEH